MKKIRVVFSYQSTETCSLNTIKVRNLQLQVIYNILIGEYFINTKILNKIGMIIYYKLYALEKL